MTLLFFRQGDLNGLLLPEEDVDLPDAARTHVLGDLDDHIVTAVELCECGGCHVARAALVVAAAALQMRAREREKKNTTF